MTVPGTYAQASCTQIDNHCDNVSWVHNTCYDFQNGSGIVANTVSEEYRRLSYYNNLFSIKNDGAWILYAPGSAGLGTRMDYNLYNKRLGVRYFAYWGNNSNSTQFTSLAAAKASLQDYNLWDNHSIDSSADIENVSTGKLKYYPSWNYTGIDKGIEFLAWRTTDVLGNPVYGAPDIGAIEYQPPYDIATDSLCAVSNVRLYADGQYRYKSACTGAAAPIHLAPKLGWSTYSATATRPQFAEVNVSQFSTSLVTFCQNFTTAQNISYSVDSLATRMRYEIYLNGTHVADAQTNGAGTLQFIINNLSDYTTVSLVSVTPVTSGLIDDINDELVSLITWLTLLLNVVVMVVLIVLVQRGVMDSDMLKFWIIQIGLADVLIAIFIIMLEAMKATL